MSGTSHLSELESLRLQVADLSRALAERDRHLDRSLQDQPEQSDLLRTIVEGTAADTGEEFFRSLVRHLAQALKVRYAFVGEWRQETPGTVRALAVWSGSALAEPFEYHLQSTPCDKVVGQRMCLYESGVQRLFPEDHLLVQMEAESYCGTPLFDRSGKPLGLLVVMDDRPMTRAAFVKDLLQIFAMRAAAELQRQQADEALRASERRLRLTQFALDQAQDSVLWADDSKRFVYANEAACRSLGYSKEELLRLSIPDIFLHHDPARLQQRAEEIRQGGVATFESLHQRRDGTEFPVEISITYLEHEGKGYTCGIIRDITARKHIEQERLQSWYDLQNILETVPDVMFTLDTQGNLVNWNRRLGDVTGYSPEELLNKPALAFVPMEERDRTMSAIRRAFTEGYAELDGNMLTKEHRLIPYHWISALLKNPHGEPIGITGVGRDVSDKKRAEEELKQQRRHLVDAQAIAHLGSWEWDIDSGEAQWSDELYRIFGHEPGSIRITYDTFLAALFPDDHDLVLAAINNALRGTTPYDIECRIVRPNGDVRVMHTRGEVYRDATGHPLSMAGTVLDITERKQVEDALCASEERWQLAVRGSNDGIWDWDIQTGDVFFSSRWKAMRGFEDHEITNHVDEWRSRIHPDDLDRVLQSLEAYLAKQMPEFCEEYRVQRKDESYMWILDRGVALWAEDGTPTRMTGSEADVTERKRAEEALRESEERFALAVEGSNDILWDAHRLPGEPWYAPQTLIWWSPRVRELLGLEESESFETLEQWAVRLHPDDKDRVFGQLAAHIEHRVPYDAEYRLCTNRGHYLWIRGRGQAMWDEQGEIRRMSGSCQDITDRKANEQLLAVEKRVLEMIATDAPLQEVLALMCRTVEVLSEGALCSILLLDPDGLHLRHGAAPSLPEAYIHAIDGVAIGPNVGSCGTAAFTRRQVIVSNIADDPLWTDYRDLALCHGLRACWSMPVTSSDGNLLGTFAVYYREPKQPTDADLQLIERATHIACIAIERKRGEESIREAELRYRTIFEQAGAGVAQIESHTGRFVKVNRQYCEIVGLTEAEMLATTFGAISHPDDLERDLESMTGLRSGEIPSFTMEKRYVRKDGSIVWVNLNVAPLWGPGETPVHHIAIVQDITERKRAEDALRRSECQLRTVLDALPVGVWFTDQSGKPVLANPAAKQIWSGIKQIRIESAANAAGWWEAIGPSNELHRWALSHALTKGAPSLNETLDLECLDGTKKAIRNTTVPVQDEAGVVLGAIVLNEDITALRQAQEALKLTQFSVDHAVEGFFWIGPDARILNVNEAACRVLEYTRDELTTMTVHDINPTFHPELWSAHWEELKQKGSMTFESKHWSKTGRVLDTEVTVNYLSYEGREYNCAIMRDIGERKRAEASLGQSEERYRSLVDNAPIGIFVNEDGRFAYVNREMQRILNATSAEQLIGMTVLDRIDPEFHQMVKARISQLMDNGQPVPSLDEQYVRLDGSRVDVAVTAIPTSFDGTPVMQVLVLDIAERKQAEEALRKNHSLLSAIMDTATDFIYVKDLAGRYLLTNPSLAQFMGKSVEEVLGQDDHALLPPELAASCMTADQQVITTGTAVTQEEYGIVGGKTAVYLTTKAPYRDPEGRIIGVIGVSRDISERKRAEEELQKSHSFIRQIIDTDPNFVFAKDREGRFTLVNQAVADAYGATVDELIGKTDADFDTNLGEVEFFRKKDLEVMDSLQERFIPEETITDSTGRIRWLQTVKRPILDEQGRAIMVLGAATDITDRKRMEEALRQRERDLRAAIEERERISQDLHDGILQSLFAVGLALEATKLMMSPRNRKTSGPPLDQAIDQLNRVMHEIRNFIAGLGSDLLQGKDLSTALQHMLASLTQNQAIRVRLSVEDCAAQAVSAEQSLHLLLVIQEAVSNCIRHGHAPEAMVSLKMLKQGVRLSIRDNGRGFNQEAAKGTGHGLSNMAARARKIGGRFTILSKVNKGTRIVLDLPKEASFVCR